MSETLEFPHVPEFLHHDNLEMNIIGHRGFEAANTNLKSSSVLLDKLVG